MAHGGSYTPEEKARLTQLVSEGTRVLQEVDDLKEGLRDTVKAIAEEMECKPTILNKAIRTAYKSNWQEQLADIGDLEGILETVGKTL
jgi:transposase-like protein